MASSLLITLREGLEAALILGIILAYLARTGHRDKAGAVWLGTVSSIVLSVAAGVAIFLTAGGLEGHAEEIFEGATMVAAAGVLTYMIFWMRRQAIGIRAHLQAQVQTALESGSLWALGLLAFVAVGREGLETVLFMIAAITTASASAALLGGGLGLAAAAVLGYLLYRGTYRLNLRAFFNVTSILLLLFAAGLLAHGLHEFHEAGLVPALVEPVWNTNAVLDERSLLGSFLAALFGYNGDPSLVEVVAYGGYLGLVGWAYFRPPTLRELRPTTERVG
ncbi:MAG: iron uptake transporter permease EfeU [Armatimonadota bacterium]|nr:iron uptake transporter permease EfeU [Armatimonadota bacterium]MDR7487349.1 iron uptake transporter permease EfeU [Armatimonadota bacterium]MDR7490938.1 iron uptake transporter permease EfeU [Armatimonadota bacterium]MDR7584517.1 iron uptake transporter permease EfeU [Armatimonadota bacterium]